MAAVGFYHLTRQAEARALARLLGRTLDEGRRALVLAPDAGAVAALDDALWAQDDVPWLPHGSAATGHEAMQPVWLAAADAAPIEGRGPNGAAFLFTLGGVAHDPSPFERAFDLFDGRREAEVAAARERYRARRREGHAVTYWREGERGWERPEPGRGG